MKKILLSSVISALALSTSVGVQAEDFNQLVNDGSVNVNLRYRAESADVKGGADAALANTLKTRITVKTGAVYGLSALVEGDNVYQITDEFYDKANGNANTDYDLILDQETTQLNQAYLQYVGAGTTIKAGNQLINLDNQRHVGGVAFRQDEATFDAISVNNTSIDKTTVFVALANNRNSITNDNTEESIALLNVKYAVSDQLAVSGYYYGINDLDRKNSGIDVATIGARVTGSLEGDIKYEVELATQNKSTASTDTDALYYLLSASKKIDSVTATLAYEVMGSDGGNASFLTPLGTNHKFMGWSDTYLQPKNNNGIQDLNASVVTTVSGIKLVAQLHKFDAVETSTDLGSELGLLASKQFGQYGASLKVAQFNAGDTEADATKIWLTGTAKF